MCTTKECDCCGRELNNPDDPMSNDIHGFCTACVNDLSDNRPYREDASLEEYLP